MTATKILGRASWQIPQLAVTAFICWSLGTSSHANIVTGMSSAQAAQIAPAAKPEAVSASKKDPSQTPQNMQVLSLYDEALYRKIFAAQQKMDWQTADQAIMQLHDKRLMGHVLADRYQRRGAAPDELRDWLAAYKDFPQAADMYDEARSLPLAKGSHFVQPVAEEEWAGGSSYGSSFGFKTEGSEAPMPPVSRAFFAKIGGALRHGNPDAAKAMYEAERMRRNIPAGELAEIQSHIAAGYFYEGEAVAARRMVSDIFQNPNPLGLWIYGLSAWRQSDASDAAQAFAMLAAQPGLSSWDRAAADYWAYRAYKHSGDNNQANYWLKQAASQPHSFYGLLASYLMGRDVSWSWGMPEWNAKAFSTLAARPAGSRALALIQIDQPSLAELELRHLNPQGHRPLQSAMLALAEKAHLPSLTMQLGGLVMDDSGKLYDAALYPVPPWQPHKGFKIDRALIYALMRHESHFNPEAVSDSGACGLMQLMPMTAHLIANDNKATNDECSDRLLDPVYNIELGQKYVGRLADQPMIGNNLMFLLAAYNSGPAKVMRWMEDADNKDPLLFLESMPIRETRDYVQQVLVHYWIYRARLNQTETSLAQLAHGQWPRYVLRDQPLVMQETDAGNDEDFRVASNQK